MEAYAIVIESNEISEAGYAALAKSSYKVGNEFKLKQFKAITPDIVEKDMYDQFHMIFILCYSLRSIFMQLIRDLAL